MEHVAYMSLPKFDRATVSKLAAILRIAFSMDESFQQKIKNFNLVFEKDQYTLWVSPEAGDISAERKAVQKRGDLFSEVFGAPVQLKTAKTA